MQTDFEINKGIARHKVAEFDRAENGFQRLDILHGVIVFASSLGLHQDFKVFYKALGSVDRSKCL